MSDKTSRRKTTTSAASTVVSISLVLFVLGVLGLVLLNAQKLSDYVKENIVFQVFLKENVKEVDIIKLQKSLDAQTFVKSTDYVAKEEAAAILQEDLGEDFISFLGYNPLLASIDVYLEADYANLDSLAWIEKELIGNTKIKEVEYSPDLLEAVNHNVRKISLFLLIPSALLLIIAIALINNTIRLAIYSKRFLIKSMQLVGATPGFIKRPFILRGVLQGIFGALISIGLLIGILITLQQQLPDFFELNDMVTFGILFALVLLLGIVIAWISTSLSVARYIRTRHDDLYYK